jgi:hypothetical protein
VVPMDSLLGDTACPPRSSSPAAAPPASTGFGVIAPQVAFSPAHPAPGERNPFLGDSSDEEGATEEEARAAQRAMAERLRVETEQGYAEDVATALRAAAAAEAETEAATRAEVSCSPNPNPNPKPNPTHAG